MEEIQNAEVEIISSEVALLAQTKGEIDIQIATAKQYPRSLKEFFSTAEELATVDEDTADSCWYQLPARKGGDGKKIEGPSVRLAEIVAYSWGNLRAETNIESIDEKFVTSVASAYDVQRNFGVRVRTKRRITTKEGRRYGDDMIQTTAQAAQSIAFREAVFKVVPRSFVKRIYDKALLVSRGDATTLAARRNTAFNWLRTTFGTQEKVILEYFGRKSIDEITLDDLVELKGIGTAMKDGLVLPSDAFRREEEKETASELSEKIKSLNKDREKKLADMTASQTEIK